jgi:hypothetical protein
MPDQCAKVRITQKGGFAGQPVELVNVARTGLDEAQSQTMDEVCHQLLSLTQADSAVKVGADTNLRYEIRIEPENGKPCTFEVPDSGMPSRALGGIDIRDIIARLKDLSR